MLLHTKGSLSHSSTRLAKCQLMVGKLLVTLEAAYWLLIGRQKEDRWLNGSQAGIVLAAQ